MSTFPASSARRESSASAVSAPLTPTWDLYVQPGKKQEERGGSGQRVARSPTSSSRTGVQRWAPKSEAEKPADAPFFDDPIDDLGGGL